MKTKVSNYVEYYDLEKFVKERYGHKIEIVAMEEASNDTSLVFFVDGVISSGYSDKIEHWLETGEFFHFGTNIILQKLCYDSYIPAGEYVIEVSW